MKKKTGYILAILILAGLFAVINFIHLIFSLLNIKAIFNSPLPLSSIGDFIFTLGNIVILSIYFFRLYFSLPGLIRWTDISFGFLGLQVIIMRIFYIVETGARISWDAIVKQGIGPDVSIQSYAVSMNVFIGAGMVLAIGAIWYTFRNHLKNKKKNSDSLFDSF